MASLRILLMSLVLGVFFAACGESNPTAPADTTGTDTTATDTVPGLDPAEMYQPLGVGYSWTYTGTHNYTVELVGETLIDGHRYFIGESTTLVTDFIRYDSGSYYYSPMPTTDGATLVLKEDAAVGDSWTTTRMFGSTLNHYRYEMVERGATRKVNDSTYDDVLQLHVRNWVMVNGDTVNVARADYYYARGVGMIEAKVGSSGALAWIRLRRYSIRQ